MSNIFSMSINHCTKL